MKIIVCFLLTSIHQLAGRNLNVTRKTLSTIVNGIDSLYHPFFVRIIKRDEQRMVEICGGSVIGQYWVLTAAHCFDNQNVEVFVELADFTETSFDARNNEIFLIDRIFLVDAYLPVPCQTPLNDIALVKTQKPISDDRIIEVCERDVSLDTLLGHCGLGSTFASNPVIWADRLKEAYFYEVPFDLDGLAQCRPDTICTRGLNEYSFISEGDSGGPLYQVVCGTRVPNCVYGVATHILLYENDRCVRFVGDRSYFARVPMHLDWIRHTIESN